MESPAHTGKSGSSVTQDGKYIVPNSESPIIDPLVRLRAREHIRKIVESSGTGREPNSYAHACEMTIARRTQLLANNYEIEYARVLNHMLRCPENISRFEGDVIIGTADEVLDPETAQLLDEQGDASSIHRENFKKLVSTITAHLDDQGHVAMRCRRCGSRVEFDTRQTRSGDEGSTIFCMCQNPKCGHRWKMAS